MNLPFDVVDEILSLLPAKSLCKFKVVCKDWYTHIQSKSFIEKNSENQIANPKILIYQYNHLGEKHAVSICNVQEKQDDEDEDEDEDGDILTLLHQTKQHMPLQHLKKSNVCDEVDIVGTCNGIVCLDNTKGFRTDSTYDKLITLWNPTTREFKTLPLFQLQRPPGTSIYGDHVGFGFDYTTDDYKVIRILYFRKEGSYRKQQEYIIEIKIYSLSTNSWREFDSSGFSAKIVDAGTNHGMLFGNKLCWLARNLGDIERNNECYILSFDICKEVFQKTPLPSEYSQFVDNGRWSAQLLDMHDSIALVLLYSQGFIVVSLEIKNLGQGRSSWIKMFSSEQISGFPLGFWKWRNSGDLFVLFRGKNGSMNGINMNNGGQIKSNRPMTIKVNNNSIVFPKQVFTYQETLVSVNRS